MEPNGSLPPASSSCRAGCEREVRVTGHPAIAARLEQERGSARPRKRRAVGSQTEGVPGHYQAQRVPVAQAAQLGQTECEIADVRPDLSPLLLFESLSADDHGGV